MARYGVLEFPSTSSVDIRRDHVGAINVLVPRECLLGKYYGAYFYHGEFQKQLK